MKIVNSDNLAEFKAKCDETYIKSSDFQNLAQELFPVGSYYVTESETTPASLFGGSWARVSGYFLYGAALQTSVGITGGEIEHTLTVSEIHSHEHVIYLQPNKGSYNGVGFYTNGGGYNNAFAEKAYLNMNGQGGAAHNNMPPYRQVNIWRRTA